MMTELTLCATALSNIATSLTTLAPAYVAIGIDLAAISCGAQLIRFVRNEDETGAQFDVRVLEQANSMSPVVIRMTFSSFRKMLADNER